MTAARVAPKPAGFFADLATVAGRGLRSIPREPEFFYPALFIPAFFFFVQVGSLKRITEARSAGFDYEAFFLPMGIVFAVTGVSRATTLVTDIQGGYFDRLCVTPVRRLALLLGLMVSDFVLALGLTVPVLILGFAYGVRFETGAAGILAFMLFGALWALAYAGFPYAIALKTGNPAAVNSSFLIFFPFAFLTTAFVPEEALSGWLSTVADINPVTYLLAGMRSLVSEGWRAGDLLGALVAVGAVGVLAHLLALGALRGRARRG